MTSPQFQIKFEDGRVILTGTSVGLDTLKATISEAQKNGSAAYGDTRIETPDAGMLLVQCVAEVQV